MTTSGPEWRVLVVDDDSVDRESVRRGLRRAGLSAVVAEASSGDEALEMIARQRFDCVFLDYNLPDTDGFTLLPEIRREARGAPVIALTGHGDEHVAVRLM